MISFNRHGSVSALRATGLYRLIDPERVGDRDYLSQLVEANLVPVGEVYQQVLEGKWVGNLPEDALLLRGR
jgi:hypothetical protein